MGKKSLSYLLLLTICFLIACIMPLLSGCNKKEETDINKIFNQRGGIIINYEFENETQANDYISQIINALKNSGGQAIATSGCESLSGRWSVSIKLVNSGNSQTLEDIINTTHHEWLVSIEAISPSQK